MTTREVVLDGGPPWGFRIRGGADTKSPLKISRVNSNSKAALSGVREGDIINAINGHPVRNLTCYEAHTLVKSTGDKLQLELNSVIGSPRQRKRNKAKIHETQSETFKSSNSTLFSRFTTKTIVDDTNNEHLFKREASIEDQKYYRDQADPPLSPNSTVSSDISSSSTLTEGGSHTQVLEHSADSIATMPLNSKNKKKRARNQKRKPKKTNDETIRSSETKADEEKDMDVNINEGPHYKVDFPEQGVSKSNVKNIVKSRSLDDDDNMVKIQEVTGTCENTSEECQAIISETDWEQASSLKIPLSPTPLNTLAICIDEEPPQRNESLSPLKELHLRLFLEGMNLSNTPDLQVTPTSLDSIKIEKERKQQALLKYFSPQVHNPRYLDIISEEGSDLSDRETMLKTQHLKRGTPELELNPEKKQITKMMSPRVFRKKKYDIVKRSSRKEEKAVLVQTKILDVPTTMVKHHHISSDEETKLEKVFIHSSSDTSDDSEEESTDLNEDDSKEIVEQEDFSSNVDSSNEISQITQNSIQGSMSSDGILKSRQDTSLGKSHNKTVSFHTDFHELTPPPTPESSPKNKLSADNSIDLEECMRGIMTDTAQDIVSVITKISNKEDHLKDPIEASFTDSEDYLNSRSPSESSSSSRGTSPSTVRLNPMNSSVADVSSIMTDLELAKEASHFKQPLSLRQLCLSFFIALPCGADILLELSEISKNLDSLTEAVECSKAVLKSDFAQRHKRDLEIINEKLISEATKPLGEEMWAEKWTALPLQQNSNILLYVSPSQKSYLDKSGVREKESDILLDLHSKFLEREDKTNKKGFRNSIAITPDLNGFKKDETTQYEKIGKSKTLPRNLGKISENSRLDATNLKDWLRIARGEIDQNVFESEAISSTIKKEKLEARSSDTYQSQMQYILEKEREIERELQELLKEKKKLLNELGETTSTEKSRPKSFPPSCNETLRQQMYDEYMKQVFERENRKHHKIIKITSIPKNKQEEKEESCMKASQIVNIEDEFMKKVEEKLRPLEEKNEDNENSCDEPESILLMDGNSFREASELPNHLREFIEIAKNASHEVSASDSTGGIWAPGQKQDFIPPHTQNHRNEEKQDDDAPPTIWQPKNAASSPIVERKEYRPVNFESPKLARKNRSEEVLNNSGKSADNFSWQDPAADSDSGIHSSAAAERSLPKSQSVHSAGFSVYSSPRLPKAQNPTITLLQKAREGQLPRGANYLEANREHYQIPNETSRQGITHELRRIDHRSESDSEIPYRVVNSSKHKIEGLGPMTKDGMPLSLRSEVRDANQSKWYKKMYDTIHKQKPYKDEYVTVRYKQNRAQYPYITGYLSEPEAGAYDSDNMNYKYATLDRRRMPITEKENFNSSTMPRKAPVKTSSTRDIVHQSSGTTTSNPGRIENYTPGHSSISDQESKRWWDEVMDIFDGNFIEEKKPATRGYMSQALKESGYESDSTLIFRRKEEANRLNPTEQKEAYKIIQKGGDIPLHGLRKPAPEPRKEPEPPTPPPKGQHGRKGSDQGSPKKYVENQVTIHYKSPVRQEIKEYHSEDEIAQRQQEAMKKMYQEERRRKYLQELQDMHNRRHTDNFTPSQKSPISLNRYDDFDDLVSPPHRIRPRSPEPRLVAKALYNFVGMTPRELTFRKCDNIFVRRQIDKNWYEGELNAMVGLFPVNYVEIIPYENVRSTTTPRKPHEGQARAKFNFLAKTHLELSLAKGEMVVITRRVDNNWYEGKIGGRRGIFPASYVDVLIDPQDPSKECNKPVASPAAHSLMNGIKGRESMGSHTYIPHLPRPEQLPLPQIPRNEEPVPSYRAKPVQVAYCNNRVSGAPLSQTLHVDVQSVEPSAFRALYKYVPQNDDELELMEGDTIFVLEKCDDGWFVGSNERSGAFGTFPGNYVEKA